MLNRRNLFGVSMASGLSSVVSGRKAAAKTTPYDLEPRGVVGRMERLPRLDLESQEDFLTGFRIWANEDMRRAANMRARKILRKQGLDFDADLETHKVLELIGDDPIVASSARLWLSCQQIMWRNLQTEFHANADKYLAEMEAADDRGPGSLELNPDMELPEYTKWEIHMQPGGYVGDPFAGHIYHYGTNNFWQGRNYQDEIHGKLAASVPLPPADGKVKRILDLGCSVGQMTVKLKERFPDAEVWGLDVGGPMVRYAHMRAVDLDIDVKFVQRLAEDTKFPDGHFDMVTSFLLFHEVNSEGAKNIIKEAYRVLRPGGVFYPMDQRMKKLLPKATAYSKFQSWWIWRWNHEVWRMDHQSNNYPEEMRKVGFHVDVETPAQHGGRRGAMIGIKPA